MSIKIRYSPAALKDLDDVWDDVFEASKSSVSAALSAYRRITGRIL